ncbi:hypothetical protein V8D89_013054 [Ganoderma adspersum]
MSIKTVRLGGTASNITVGKVAHGLMTVVGHSEDAMSEDEAVFAAIKAGVDLMPPGVKMFLNSAEFYGPGFSTGNLEVLSRFYDKYPNYVDRTFLSVKGAMKPGTLMIDGSRTQKTCTCICRKENLRRSLDTVIAALRGTKKVDLFEMARVDPKLKNEGKCDHIGMSECRAETLRKANGIHPIAAVEIEVSLWSYEEETKKVIVTSEELGIPVIAYSPLGRGLLTGTINNPNDIAEKDFRRNFDRFQEETMKHNQAILDAIKVIATKKQISLPQLALAWVASRGPHVIPLPGSSKPKRVVENCLTCNIELTQEEQDAIADVLARNEVQGERYVGGPVKQQLHLWG